MYEIADTIDNIMQDVWLFFKDMNVLKMIILVSIVIAVVILFQFKWTRLILKLTIGLAILAVAFAFVYGFIYAVGGDGIVQLIVALGLVSVLAYPVFTIIIVTSK